MTKHPDPVDVYVGGRIKLCRKLLGLSMQAVAKELGLSFQQVQKYEKGANRMGAGRLYALSVILDVPVSFFFDGLKRDRPPDTNPAVDFQVMKTARCLENIPDKKVRDAFRVLATAMSKACAPTTTSDPEE